MDRRTMLSGFLVAAASSASNKSLAQPNPLILPTSTQQGGVLRGRAPVGCTLRLLGSVVSPFAPDSTGGFAIGLSRDSPTTMTVTSTAVGDVPAGAVTLAVRQRHYLSVTISGTARTSTDPVAAVAPNAGYGMYRGDDLFDGGDPELPQDASERAAIVSQSLESRETRQQRLTREVAAKQAAFQSRLPLRGYLEQFLWPVIGRTTSEWGAQRVIITAAGEERPSRPHGGIDIRAVSGASVRAPASGAVVLADADFFFEGGVVFIDHGQGLISAYLHLSRVDCAAGQVLAAGDVIGLVGATGRATGPHLCWRMKWRGVDVDPTSLLAEAS